jgi:hypothetical protein
MRSLIRAVPVALVALAAVAWPFRAAAAQDPAHADSPRVSITVDNPTLVGATLVKPGSYKFQCRHFDGKTFLVVTDAGNKEIVRVPCEQETLSQKNENSELRSLLRPDGQRVLQSVRIKGEIVAHRLVG